MCRSPFNDYRAKVFIISRTGRVWVLTLALGAAVCSFSSAGADAIDIGTYKQLFVGPWSEDGRDAHLVESMKNITMTMNEARVTGERLVEPDKPWEGIDKEIVHPGCWISVVKDGDTWRYAEENIEMDW